MVSVNGDKATGRFELVLSNEPHAWEPHPLKFYVEKRHESIRAQLAGTLEGDSVGFGAMPHIPEQFIAVGILFLVMLLFNTICWVWGIVVGFKGSTLWGCLNIFFTPMAPAIYGFGVRRDLGFKCALFATVCFFGWICWIVYALIQFT